LDLLLIAAESNGWAAAIWGTTLTILQVAFGLGLVIFVHELGHFAVAKWCGVRCDKFYLGFDIFGLKLCKFQWGETEYGIGALPLGGYVKMLGQEDNPGKMQEELDTAKMAGDLPAEPTTPDGSNVVPHYDPRSYVAKSVPKRMAIISAGVIMNLIFAYIVVAICYRVGVEYYPCVISEVVAGDPAWQMGLRSGDEIVELNGVDTPYFVDDLMQRTALADMKRGIELKVLRPGIKEPFEVNVKPQFGQLKLRPTVGISFPPCTNKLREGFPVSPETPSSESKPAFEGNDEVLAINDTPVTTYAEVQQALLLNANKPVKVLVRRTSKPKAEEGAKDSAAPEAAKTTDISIDVQACPQRSLGLIMKMGAISAVQVDSPAAAEKLQVGDTLLEIDGVSPGDPLTLPDRLRKRSGETIQLTINRSGEKDPLKVSVKLRKVDWFEAPWMMIAGNRVAIPELGIALFVENTIQSVEPGSPAEKAGLKPNDQLALAEFIPASDERKELEKKRSGDFEIKFMNEKESMPVYLWFFARLQNSLKDTEVRLTTTDGRTVTMLPVDSDESFNYDRGFHFDALERIQKADSWGDAFSISRRKTWGLVTLVYRTLQKLVTGQLSFKNLGGPGTIAAAAGHAASAGMTKFFMFLAMLSANLAVINFLPIPLLDGGHMLLLAIEGVRGKPVSEKYAVMLQYVGLAFILGLMATVFTLDGLRLFDYVKWLWS
jgi:regulator of sigma E protease